MVAWYWLVVSFIFGILIGIACMCLSFYYKVCEMEDMLLMKDEDRDYWGLL